VGRFDAESGTLELVPASPAYATQLRLSSGSLVTRINAALNDGQDQQQQARGPALVRSIRVLAPGSGQAVPSGAGPAPAPEPGPLHTREPAPAGYHQALAAHRAKKEEQGDGLAAAVRAAVERQDQVLRARREPEEAFGDGQEALEQLRAKARQAPVDGARARALRRLADERAGRAVPAPAVRRTA
jgi:hypothetical protein